MQIKIRLISLLLIFFLSLPRVHAQSNDDKILQYTRLLQNNPNDYTAYLYRGATYSAKGDQEAAISDYNKALQLKPDLYSTYYMRGSAYYTKGAYDLALADFNKTIQLKPDYFGAYYLRALINHFQGRFEKAIIDYSKTIELQPDYRDAYYYRGLIYFSQKKYELALADNNKAIELKPDYLGYFTRANTNYSRCDHEATVRDYTKAIQLQPDSYYAHYGLGAELYNHGDHPAAITELANLVASNPDSADARAALILSYISNKEFIKAKEEYERYNRRNMHGFIEEKDRSFLMPYVEAATKYISGNDYGKALPLLLDCLKGYLTSVIASDNSSKFGYSKIVNLTGWIYEHLDSLDRAREYYQKAIVLNPHNEQWALELASLRSLRSKESEEDRSPPEIQLFTPKTERGQDIETDDAQNRIFVSGQAKDKSGIKWVKINGSEADKLSADGYFSSYVKDVGNKIVIQAADQQGNIETGKNFTIGNIKKTAEALNINPIPKGEKPVFHAVLIACSNYNDVGHWPSLPSTIPEAKSLKEVLIKGYGFEEKNILELYDKNRDDIMIPLSSKLERMTDNDNLVILYSGHGDKALKGSLLIGYWIPINSTGPNTGYISNSDLNDLIAGTKARHVLIMSDACYSAAMRGKDDDVKKEEVTVPLKEEYKFSSRRILTSGGLEKVPGTSTFMKLVIESLERNTDPLFSEMYLYSLITPGVRNQTGRLPVIQDFGKDGNHGGQFYFIKKMN